MGKQGDFKSAVHIRGQLQQLLTFINMETHLERLNDVFGGALSGYQKEWTQGPHDINHPSLL